MTRGRIVVWGMLAARPFGGMIWQVIHHLVPLRRLGFDAWYVEDSRIRLSDPATWGPTEDAGMAASFLAQTMAQFGFGDRWVLRAGDARSSVHGALDRAGLDRLYETAGAVLNLCGAHFVRADHAGIRKLVMIETDPGYPQVRIANGDEEVIDQYARHHHLFTYAGNIGAPDCTLPLPRFTWHVTRPPVGLELWGDAPPPLPGAPFTTVAAWRSRGKDVTWRGERWSWSKHREFERFLDLPSRTRADLEIAIEGATPADRRTLRAQGWRLAAAMELSGAAAYRDYIRASAGEFTAAKEQYVRPRTGWFSDRTVCYLAAGRPAIVQDTGLSWLHPTGEGLLPFSTPDEAAAALDAVLTDPRRHARAAREIAREEFNGEKVLGSLLETIGLL